MHRLRSPRSFGRSSGQARSACTTRTYAALRVVAATRLALTAAALCLAVSCEDSGASDDDPLRNAEVVHCDMPLDHACIEYDRVRAGERSSFVVLAEARSICAQGWPGGSPAPGVFAGGPCEAEQALARCRIIRGYVELDYYNAGFADSATRDDPLTPLGDLCSRSGGGLEQPPF